MPIYKKVFYRKKNQTWCDGKYRELIASKSQAAITDGTLQGEQSSTANRFLVKLIEIKIVDLNLKFVFDHIRNYSIAATVLVAGFYLFKHGGQTLGFTWSGVVFGLLFLIVGFMLYCLNFVQVIWALIKLKVRVLPYLIISLILFAGTSELLWVLVRQLIEKSR